jgi:hypothetical protein
MTDGALGGVNAMTDGALGGVVVLCCAVLHRVAFDQLILDNTAVLVAVNLIGEVVMFLGKVIVACLSAFVCFWYLDRTAKFQDGGSAELSSEWLCVLVSADDDDDDDDVCVCVCRVWDRQCHSSALD